MRCDCLLGNVVRQHYTGCDAVDGGTFKIKKAGDKRRGIYCQQCSHCRRPLGERQLEHLQPTDVGADGANHRGDDWRLLRRLAGTLRIIIIIYYAIPPQHLLA